MLTELQRWTLWLSRSLYSFLPPLPFHWKPDYSGLEFLFPKQKRYPWEFSMLMNIFTCAACYIIVFVHLFVQPAAKVSLKGYCILLVSGGISLITILISHTLYQANGSALHAANTIINLWNSVRQKYRPRRRRRLGESRQSAGADMFLFLFVLGSAPAPVVVSSVIVYDDLDVYYFLLEPFLPNPMHRALPIIVGTKLFRFLLICWWVAETSRMFAVPTIWIVLNNLRMTLERASAYARSTPQFCEVYSKVELAFLIGQKAANTAAQHVISWGFWMNVGVFWYCIEGEWEQSGFVYVIFSFVGIVLLGASFIAFEIVCKITNNSKDILEKKKKHAILERAAITTRARRYALMKVSTLREIQLKFGNFFVIERATQMAYYLNVTDSIVNYVIMFDL